SQSLYPTELPAHTARSLALQYSTTTGRKLQALFFLFFQLVRRDPFAAAAGETVRLHQQGKEVGGPAFQLKVVPIRRHRARVDQRQGTGLFCLPQEAAAP